MREKGGSWTAGVARRVITPPRHVDLAGLGYYLARKGERVASDLAATALVIGCDGDFLAIVAMDLMWNDEFFTRLIRDEVKTKTGIPESAVCVNFSHSHNAPTAGLILGAGEQDWAYLRSAAKLAAEAVAEAFRNQKACVPRIGHSALEGMTFNRTRENGPVDTTVSALRIDSLDGAPIAVGVNFHSHCTAHMESALNAIGRDWPGDMVDLVEAELPGAMCLYLQGTCGDVNFRREYNGTEKRSQPGKAVAAKALEAYDNARLVHCSGIKSAIEPLSLPARRWTREEINREREEGLYRLKSGDITGWLDGVARVCVNLPERLPLRYGGSVEKAVHAVSRFAVEWTDRVLLDLDARPEVVNTAVQTMRIGDIYLTASPCEIFTTTGISVRSGFGQKDLLMLAFSNGSIGYLPDAHDVRRKSYAAIQSPKFTGQFPFTEEAAEKMAEGLVRALQKIRL